MEMLFGLLIALLINRSFRGRGLVRAAVLIPWATPTAISAMMWQFLYDGQNGVIARLFYRNWLDLRNEYVAIDESGSDVLDRVRRYMENSSFRSTAAARRVADDIRVDV